MFNPDETSTSLPPMAVVVANTMQGVTLPDIVQYLTIAYLVVLIGYKGWRWYREWRTGKLAKGGNDDEG